MSAGETANVVAPPGLRRNRVRSRRTTGRPARAPRAVVVALFLTTLVTLALQICASRILSVTLSYHYAFLIVALAPAETAGTARATPSVDVVDASRPNKGVPPLRSDEAARLLRALGGEPHLRRDAGRPGEPDVSVAGLGDR